MGFDRAAADGFSFQPEVLHAIYMRVLQIVYGIRLEHFYMVSLTLQPGPDIGGEFLGGICTT